MLSLLLFISSISVTTSSDFPVASLVDESTDSEWRRYKIDRSMWTATADSEQTTDQVNEGPISNILTGDPNKIWLTKINNNGQGGHDDRSNKKGPFRFTINLHRRTTFKAFSLMPRQSGDQGKMKLYEFYAAQNESELNTQISSGQYLAKGTIDPNEIKSTLVVLPGAVSAYFVAVRSMDQESSASCAEFNLYEDPENPEPTSVLSYLDVNRDKFWTKYKIDRSGWTATANSENGVNNNDGPASNMIDGNTNTIWHTKYNSGHDDRPGNTGPFIATINLGQETTFRAFTYMPRQSDTNGEFRHYEFYVAQTQEQLTAKINNNEYLSRGDIDHTLRLSTLVVFRTAQTGQFVALKSYDHDGYATCAEFDLYSDSPEMPGLYSKLIVNEITDNTWNPYKIDRSGWTATANSENGVNNNDGPASNMIDGNTNTIWHTKYNSGHDDRPGNTGPFIATINLGQETTFVAFSYMPRQSDKNGEFKRYEFYAAQTEEELNTLINETQYTARGEINKTSKLSTFIMFEKPITARYVALISLDHDNYATCAEFNLYNGIPSNPLPIPPPVQTQLSSKACINEATDTFWTPYKIDRTGWKIRANSEERTEHNVGDGPLSYIKDGNANTWWHSNYGTGHDDRNSNEKIHFSIDLGQETTFKAFSYRPRISNSDSEKNGRFKHIEFYSANTSEELFTKIKNRNHITEHDIDDTLSISTFIIFKEQQTARHIAVMITDSINNFATCAEFNVYTEPPPVEADQSPMTNQEGLINLTCDKFTYENWPEDNRCVSGPNANFGSFTSSIGAKAKITFNGIKVHLLARKENGPGIAYVRIDDTVVGIIDFNSYGSDTNCIIFSSNELDYNREHTLELESLSTSKIIFGSVYINPFPRENSFVLGHTNFNQIEGEWTHDSSTPPVLSSSSNPASGTFEFYGTRFYLTGVRGSNVGNMKISLDDGDFITITEKQTADVAQNNKAIKLYDSDVIDFKMHTLKIQNTDSQVSIMNLLYTWYPNDQTPSQSPTPATATPTTATPTTATPTTATPTTATPTTATPTSATPKPVTPTTDPDIDEIIFDEANFTGSNRIEKEISNDDGTSIAVIVINSQFTKNTNDNGGAIHLINCGLRTDETLFQECKSNAGAGGAIYIKNTHQTQNDVRLLNLHVIGCSAEYGGGAYIYSDSYYNKVEILGCEFKNNVATKAQSDNNLYGGSAIFLTVMKNSIRRCLFEKNDVKIYIDFNSASKIISLEKSTLELTECDFKIAKNMKYSLFYYGGNHATGMKLESCTFTGQLNDGAYFIDGQLTNKNNPKMIIKSCKFSSSSKNALNQNGQFASIDLKDQIFEFDQFEESSGKKINMKSAIIISVSVFALLIVLIVSLVIIIKKGTNPNVYSNANDGIEMSSKSTDISMVSLDTPLI